MDIQALIGQVTDALGNAPEKVKDFAADPKGTIAELTGHDLGGIDLGEIVQGVRDKASEGGEGFSHIVEGLGDKIEESPLGEIGEKIGDVIENSPLGDIAEGLSGIFGGKKDE